MPRSNWLPYAALAGCLAIALWAGLALGQTEQPNDAPGQTQTQQPAPEQSQPPKANTPDIQVVRSYREQANCDGPQDHDAADFCEQRRMANAAENTLVWIQWQFWTNLVAIGGLLLSLYFARRATNSAAEQVKLSRQAMISTQRAFVFSKDTQFNGLAILDTNKVHHWRVAVQWENSGDTPTKNLRWHVNFIVRKELLPADFDFPDFGSPSIHTLLGPKASGYSAQMDLPLEQITRVANAGDHFYIWGWAEYDDVFDGTQRHRTEFCSKWFVSGDPTNSKGVSFRADHHDRYNGHDEECGERFLDAQKRRP